MEKKSKPEPKTKHDHRHEEECHPRGDLKCFRHTKSAGFLFIVILIGVASFLFAKTANELKETRFIGQESNIRSTITVSGTGEVSIVPDVGEVSFAVVKEAKESSEAQSQVTEDMHVLLDYLENFGVEDKDIKTTNYNISPRYDYLNTEELGSPRGSRTLVGYEVSHWITIKVRSLDDLGTIIGGLGSRGATNISNVRFIVEDEDASKAEARRLAIEDAETKAEILAKDLGVRIVRMVNYNEGVGKLYRGNAVYEASLSFGVAGAIELQLPVGENNITSNITITYSVE